MNNSTTPELVINATRVSEDNQADYYEFVLNEDLHIVECGHVESLSQGVISTIESRASSLHGLLFELNHVRVNPKINNSQILANLAHALEVSGVYICNPPSMDLMAMCFKPLGELSDIVRFYYGNNDQLVFLSASVRLRCVK